MAVAARLAATRHTVTVFEQADVPGGKNAGFSRDGFTFDLGPSTLTLPAVAEFDVIRLRENIKLGQRVDAFAVDMWLNNAWTEYAAGQSIGACRLIRGEKVKTDRVRLRITRAAACPCISEVGLFDLPATLTQKQP